MEIVTTKFAYCHHSGSFLSLWLALFQLKGDFPKDKVAIAIEWSYKVRRVSLSKMKCSIDGRMNGLRTKDERWNTPRPST
jgi:hypothetical protein